MFPCKGFGIAVSAGNYWDKYEALQFILQGFINIMSLQKSIVRINVKINADLFLNVASSPY